MIMKKLLLFIPLLLIPLLVTKPVIAVAQDISYTFDTNSTVPFYFCDNTQTNSQVKCSDFTHIILHPSGFSSEYYYTLAVNSTTVRFPNFTDTILDLSSVSTTFIAQLGSILGSNATLTVTLTNSLDCPEPEPCDCDCPVDCEEPFIVQLFKSGFWGVATGIVTIILPVLALFLVFRLIHDFLWGRG